MADEDDILTMVGEFLSLYYYEEGDDAVAATNALEETLPRMAYRWELARAFRQVLDYAWPPDTLKKLVRYEANRFAASDEEAKEFLQKTYNLNLFDLASNIKRIREEGGQAEG